MNHVTAFPPLRGDRTADVCVIGAGFTGVSTALHLTEHGRDEFRILSGAETRAMIGTDAYIGALLNMGNGHLHPLNLCIGEALAAVSSGATIYEQSPDLRIDDSRKPRVLTRHGAIEVNAVIKAGNAYHEVDRRLRGIMFPVRCFVIATARLPPATVTRINPRDLAVCDPNFVLEYFRLSADKRLLFGGRINHRGEDPAFIRRRLKAETCRVYPGLAHASNG